MILHRKDIEQLISTLPGSPGCYLYRDTKETVIYVGKAKNLQKRISSYFQNRPHDRKTQTLLQHFETIEYIVVETEYDALLLENNLIKRFQPQYNVLLKEGNRYPWIVVTREQYQRVFVTYKPTWRHEQVYGPYPNVEMAHTLNRLFRRNFLVRTCKLDLSPENIAARKFRPCLQYHIKRCKAPCIGLQSREEYDQNINKIERILKGNIEEVCSDLQREIHAVAEELRFEQAQELALMLEALQDFQAKSIVVSGVIGNALVASYTSDADCFYVNYFVVHRGAITTGRTLEYKKRLEEDPQDLLASVLYDLIGSVDYPIDEIVLDEPPAFELPPRIKVTIPKKGDRKKLLDLSLQNVLQYKIDKDRQAQKLNPEQRNTQLLKELQALLSLKTLPIHIECFDNSNIQGSDPVAACIAFKGAKPSKKDYRHYHIKSVSGPDDYASMQEAIMRHYGKYLEEGHSLPDLLIVDGGKGQMSTARKALDDLGITIPILGLAKDKKHRTGNLLYGTPPEVIAIMTRSPLFHLLEQIQNEVHRFAITFHRSTRSKKLLSSQLQEIPGIGPVTQKKLLREFKSVSKVKEATLAQLAALLGRHKGSTVYSHFHPKP